MAKVIKGGLLSPEIGFPLSPPAGMRKQCQCRAVIETEEIESSAEVFIVYYKTENIRLPGWKIKCPECGKKIKIDAEITPKMFQVLNADVSKLLNESNES